MKTLKWNESKAMCHAFLVRLVYGNDSFVFEAVNSCIKFDKGILDSNDKSKAQYKNEILDQIIGD